MTVEELDRLSILYVDAEKALREASVILRDTTEGGRTRERLSTGTSAALTLTAYLHEATDVYLPADARHSVKV